MTPRSRRSLIVTPSATATPCANEPRECRCCTALRRSREQACFDPAPEWASPLTPDVQAVNLRRSEDGRLLWAQLGRDWARMFSGLTFVGGGLVMTRNPGAMLGRRMPYPELAMTSGGGKGASGEDGLWLDFQHLGAARAMHERRETGHFFSVEFAGADDRIVHRFALTRESDLDEFFAWVRLHQACTAHVPAVWPTEEVEPAPPSPARALRHCNPEALTAVFTACVDRALPVRGAAATQRAEFTPRSLHPCDEEWWFATDEVTGLHFQPQLFTQVTLEEHAQDGAGATLALRAALPGNGGALVLKAGSHAVQDAIRTALGAVDC